MNKQIFSLSFVLVFLVAFTGCTVNFNAPDGMIPVTVVINYGSDLSSINVSVSYFYTDANNTAFDVLNEKADLGYTEDAIYGVFITSVNNVSNTDSTYWMFYINDEMAPVGVSAYVIQANDTIEMRYEASSW